MSDVVVVVKDINASLHQLPKQKQAGSVWFSCIWYTPLVHDRLTLCQSNLDRVPVNTVTERKSWIPSHSLSLSGIYDAASYDTVDDDDEHICINRRLFTVHLQS